MLLSFPTRVLQFKNLAQNVQKLEFSLLEVPSPSSFFIVSFDEQLLVSVRPSRFKHSTFRILNIRLNHWLAHRPFLSFLHRILLCFSFDDEQHRPADRCVWFIHALFHIYRLFIIFFIDLSLSYCARISFMLLFSGVWISECQPQTFGVKFSHHGTCSERVYGLFLVLYVKTNALNMFCWQFSFAVHHSGWLDAHLLSFFVNLNEIDEWCTLHQFPSQFLVYLTNLMPFICSFWRVKVKYSCLCQEMAWDPLLAFNSGFWIDPGFSKLHVEFLTWPNCTALISDELW